MKIILSRKGYDASCGNGASLIMPNGDLLPIPIPCANNEMGISYSTLNYKTKSYFEIMKEIGIKVPRNNECLLNPDLNRNTIQREANWSGIYGINGTALTHIEKLNLEKGDVFLFFGSFKRTFQKESLQFERDYERHIIYGYLIIDEIIHPKEQPNHVAYQSHSHFKNATIYKNSNTVYLAKDINGYGTFKYREELVLTRPGFSKSQWELPMLFHPDNGTKISRHTKKNIEIRGDKIILNSSSHGQDFVIEGNPEIEEWAKSLIMNSERAKGDINASDLVEEMGLV